MQLCQIALSGATSRASETVRWYRDGLGFLDAGGTTFSGADMAAVQGIDTDNVDFDLAWLVDRSSFMQLELFAYREPVPHPPRKDRTTADVGYRVVCIHVLDFDGTLSRLAELGTHPLSETVGPAGDRRVCVSDPNGARIELLERDVSFSGSDGEAPLRPDVNAAVRGIRLVVLAPDLTRKWFTQVLGLWELESPVHGPEHDVLWDLPSDVSAVDRAAFTDGRSFFEVVSYGDQSRDWPAGYQLCDEGILNFALGTPDRDTYFTVRGRVESGPYRLNRHLVLAEDLEADYSVDDQGFSVELIYMEPSNYAQYGFEPKQ